jgi:hypothetical protein
MFGTYSYNEIIRKTIISFGTLFNNLYIKHQNESGDDTSLIKVPISYGPIQKFLARLEQKPDLRNRVALTLPRMSFEMTSLQYDSSRKVSTVQTFKAVKGNDLTKVYMPVPYNIGIQLSVMAKYNDDVLQIVEQILPYFQPHFNLTIDLIPSIGEKRDIPITLDSISMSDDYESSYDSRRILIYTLNFTAKTYIFGPIADTTDKLIKKVQVDYYTNTNINNASRQLRYVARPRALKDYNNDATTVLAENIDENKTIIPVSDSSLLQKNTYIMINDESMYIKEISGNSLFVDRGVNSTKPSIHIEGDNLNVIDSSDDELIEYEDDFGFNEERFDFGDGRIYSPSKGVDVDL